MTPRLRPLLVPALLVVTAVGVASLLAVPDDPPSEDLSAEEIRRIDDFVQRFRLGQRLLGGGKDDKAEQVFRDLLDEEPEAAAVHHALGTLLQFRNRPEEATRYLLRAAELAPEDATIQRDAGMDLLRHRRPADAEPYLARARAIWPEDVETLVTHATCLRALGRDEPAKTAYRKALEVQPESVDARVGLAGAIYRDAPEEAVELVRELSHNYADVTLVHGLALARLGRTEDAVALLLQAALRSPRNAAGVGLLAESTRALADLGAADEGVQAAALWCAASGTPPAAEPSLRFAELLAALGRPGEALQALEQASTKGADAAVLRRARLATASLLARMGRTDDARTILTLLSDEAAESPERALAGFALGRLDREELSSALGTAADRTNDGHWAAAVRAWIEGDDAAAAAHARVARESSDPPGEFPALLLR